MDDVFDALPKAELAPVLLPEPTFPKRELPPLVAGVPKENEDEVFEGSDILRVTVAVTRQAA